MLPVARLFARWLYHEFNQNLDFFFFFLDSFLNFESIEHLIIVINFQLGYQVLCTNVHCVYGVCKA